MRKSSVQKEFGERVIDEIVRRTTEENIDKAGKKFPAYSESYKNSERFKIYDKSPNDVNLTLTQEMLSSMIVKTGDEVTIRFADQFNNDKAHGHINGIKTKKGKVVRDFFGLPEKEMKDILKSVIKDFQEDAFDFDAASKATQSESSRRDRFTTNNQDDASIILGEDN